MPRVRWRSILWYILNFFWIVAVTADCWFENERHKEGQEVPTTESCLNCTCSQGTLVCYLRVCPKFPNPPPSGCIALHRHKTCCPELVCTDNPAGNRIEARSDTFQIPTGHKKLMGNVCIANGTVYGPGSAMGTSSLCEYCYCIGGEQTCIKPKCLLSLEGCTPIFEKHNCCPVRYNCTGFYAPTSTTTQMPHWRSTCAVGGVQYEEGSKVVGIGHSACDNCYCIRGILRCEPLSCAPAILGCIPVVKPGQCCPESYNCNGPFDIQAEVNYDNHPTVSKEYAKLRKEVQLLPSKNVSDTYYVVAESTTVNQKGASNTDPSIFTTSESTTASIGKKYTSGPEPILDVRTRPSTGDRRTKPALSFGTTNYVFQNTRYKRPLLTTAFDSTTPKLKTNEQTTNKQLRASDYESDLMKIVDSFFGNDNEIEDNVTEVHTSLTTKQPTNINLTDVLSTILSTLTEDLSTTFNGETSTSLSSTLDEAPETSLTTAATRMNSTAVTAVVTTTDCIKNNDTTRTSQKDDQATSTEAIDSTSTFSTTALDYTEVDLESKVKVNTLTVTPYKKLTPDIETILNSTITNHKDYEDYDYDEPTLPPSLPNLKIIPFVAADALDLKGRDQENSLYPDRVTEAPPYSLFSPPDKTEGGFVPKQPPLIPEYYEKANSIITSATTSQSITNMVKSHEHNCIADGREIKHRETATEQDCIVCVCFYGNIICQQPPCPSPAQMCSKSSEHKVSSCCSRVVCEPRESPTMAKDRMDINVQDIITLAEGATTRDPFKNVIRTEPAPSLQMVDFPYLTRPTTQKLTVIPTTTPGKKDELSIHSILDLLLYGTPTTAGTKPENPTTPTPTPSSQKSTGGGVGLLKLAGCNIYGRMYRVGRIISELSGPCMECRCTEVGVQCTPLKC
ncbi:hypothetical protein PPYR_11964 [Photinus pyralis]|uniref:VWFC domain-containing protein n=1 Tax=Photinus pyralis TaxID=7054 RepID=A0A5N4ACS1_PHOPY|nr:uncharacterized protein LOC116175793 [Photinus pyralis]KAB0795125.1 hypothetical protein PPYR_11964 [Photinus pyralis]